jgi:hypothetical protein
VPLMPLRFISARGLVRSPLSHPRTRAFRARNIDRAPKHCKRLQGRRARKKPAALDCALRSVGRGGCSQSPKLNSELSTKTRDLGRAKMRFVGHFAVETERAEGGIFGQMLPWLSAHLRFSGGLERGVDDVDMLLVNEGLCRGCTLRPFSRRPRAAKTPRLPRPEAGRSCAPSGRKRRSDQVARDTP